MSKQTDDKSELWEGLGTAAWILALCLGVGSCQLLESHARLIDAQAAAVAKP